MSCIFPTEEKKDEPRKMEKRCDYDRIVQCAQGDVAARGPNDQWPVYASAQTAYKGAERDSETPSREESVMATGAIATAIWIASLIVIAVIQKVADIAI
jgi:hypothetical protein